MSKFTCGGLDTSTILSSSMEDGIREQEIRLATRPLWKVKRMFYAILANSKNAAQKRHPAASTSSEKKSEHDGRLSCSGLREN